MKNDINLDLFSKISNTFRAYNYHDKKIESNLFNIGAKRINLFRRSMNQMKNMIQDFNNQFAINLCNNEKKHLYKYFRKNKRRTI